MAARDRRWIRRALIAGAVATGALAVLGLPAVAGGGGCYDGATEGSGDTVALAQACPTPTIVHVDTGSTVRFVNKDPFAHNVIGVGFAWGHPEELAQGASFTHRFDAPGIYPYACWIHPGMVGAVVVSGAGAPTTAAASTTSAADGSPSPVAAEIAADPPGSAGAAIGWIVGGVLGLAIGIGVGIALRRRPSSADPGR
jgi:plastocyanin